MACGTTRNPIPAVGKSNGLRPLGLPTNNTIAETPNFDWLVQQNGGQFDPVIFGDYRESQDAVTTQDFGTFFDDAFPLPDLGSPLHNFNDVGTPATPAANTKPGLMERVEAAQNADVDEEVVPGEDTTQIMTCDRIWYVAQASVFPLWNLLTLVTGIGCKEWKNSGMARLILIISALSFAAKHAARNRALSLTRKMSMRL